MKPSMKRSTTPSTRSSGLIIGRAGGAVALLGALGLLGCAPDAGSGPGPGSDAGADGGPAGGGANTSTGGAIGSGGVGTGGRTGSGGSGSGGQSATGGSGVAGSGPGTGGGGAGRGGTTGGNGGRGTAGAAGGRGGASTGGSPGTGGAGVGGAGAAITIWIAGDSTVANGSAPCPIGWGAQFLPHFNDRVTISNRAIAGRSVQTWLYDVGATLGANGECDLNATAFLPAWTAMLTGMKAGDYLFIQFGINDTDSTCPRHVGTQLFQTDYGMMAQAAKDRGANPIFVTPVSSISCSGTTARGSRGTFATATKQAGATYNVPVIDLEQLSVSLYNSMAFCPLPGADTATTFEAGAIGNFFCEDHTHFEAAGAVQIANLVATALRDQGIGLAAYLK